MQSVVAGSDIPRLWLICYLWCSTSCRFQDLVKLLDALFLCFDKLSEQFQLVKIETVFETYLAAAGTTLIG